MHRKRCFFHLEKVTVYTCICTEERLTVYTVYKRETRSADETNVHVHRKRCFTWRK